MKLYVFDTDILTLYRQGHPSVCQRVVSHLADRLAISVMTVEEQLSGWYRLLRKTKQSHQLARIYEEMAETVAFLSGWEILHFPETVISRYDHLKSLRLTIPKMDLRIAASTLENSGILVTRNVRDFQRIPGLTVENWAN